jgi:transposase
MYIARIPNRNSPPAFLLREGRRVNGKVKSRTLANITRWDPDKRERLRRVLQGEKMESPREIFEIISSPHHGHVQAIQTAIQRLGFEEMVASRPSPERNRVMGMIVARILEPDSKLATTRWWRTTTIADVVGVADSDEEDLYKALDWLVQRQPRIEKKLVARHLKEGGLVFYDLSSSYFEGVTCPLAARGHNRDGKKGKLQVNYGLLTDPEGRPVSVSVFPGNTGDPKTLMPQVRKVKDSFGIKTVVMVGDRGMISQTRIDELKKEGGVDWITALKSGAIRELINARAIQIEFFDERNLFEFTHPDFPGERLTACRNPSLGSLRGHKRRSMLEATVKELKKVKEMVERGRLKGKEAIGVRVGRVINKYQMAKHFVLEIEDEAFEFHIDEEKVTVEAALDGIYVLRTSLGQERVSADETVRQYKNLSQVERAFRSLKTLDLQVRPIHHRLENRVRAHIFLCMLAYYVEWHMREAWRPVLFCDENQEIKKTRDPVAPATRSQGALKKVHSGQLEDGSVVHSFQTMLKMLSTITRNRCRFRGDGPMAPTFDVDTTPNAEQERAYRLLETIRVLAERRTGI